MLHSPLFAEQQICKIISYSSGRIPGESTGASVALRFLVHPDIGHPRESAPDKKCLEFHECPCHVLPVAIAGPAHPQRGV